MRNGVMTVLGMFVGVWAPPRVVLVPWTPLPRAVGVGTHAKAPGALAVACAVGPRGGSGAFLVDYTICFPFRCLCW